MEEKTIQKVMEVLTEWNPLGDRVADIPDLDGYRTEAIDILFEINLSGYAESPSAVASFKNPSSS